MLPLLKESDRSDPNYYRPYYLHPALPSNNLKKLVNKQLTHFLDMNSIIYNLVVSHGCTTATMKVVNNIIAALDKAGLCYHLH